MKKRLLPITALAFLTMSALVGCGGGDSGGSSGGGSVPPIVVVDVTGVSLNKTTLDLVKGGQETLVATVEPANATDSSVSWKSANTSIATVENGVVKAVDAGSTTITVTTNDGGFKATCAVNVSVNLNSLTITNKADFEGKKVGDAAVSLALTSDPVVNMTDMATKGLLHISSSDESVATVSGLGIHFKAGGTTTIKAELFGKSDQFDLTVEGKKSNKELYGTDHEGDEVDPFTNEDALKVAKILEQEDPKFPTLDEVYVKGEVESFYRSHLPGSSNKLCSWYLKPATEGGEKFEAYKIVKADDTVWEETDIWVGAVATFKFTKFAVYNGQYECTTGEIVKVEGEAPVPPQNIDANVAKCLEVAAALAENESTYDNYVVEGYIINVTDPYSSQYGNVTFDLGDEKESAQTISVYRGKPSAEDGAEMIASAKVKVTGKLTKYVSSSGEGDPKLQFAQGAKVELLEKGDKPTEVIKANVAEAMAACLALEDGATSSDKYEVTGYVTSVQEKSTYTSYDYWIADSAETAKEESLQVYRGLPSADYEKLAVGTKVVVTGNLKKFVKTSGETTTVTLEMVNTSFVIDGEGGEGGGGGTPVDENNYGSLEEPLSVATAIALLDKVVPTQGTWTSQDLYVTGKVSKVSYNSSYQSYTIDLYNGETPDAFEIYSGKLADGVNADDVQVGAVICAYGPAKIHTNGMHEIAYNSTTKVSPSVYSVELDRPELTGIKFDKTGPLELVEGKTTAIKILPVEELALLPEENPTWESSDPTVASISEGNNVGALISALKEGTTKITAEFNEQLKAEITVNVVKSSGEELSELEVALAATSFTADSSNSKLAHYTSGIATFTLDQNKSSSANRLSDGDHIRVYKNAKFGVTLSSGKISVIEFTVTHTDYAKAENFSVEGAEVEVEGLVVTITLANPASTLEFVAANQVRLNNAKIFYQA